MEDWNGGRLENCNSGMLKYWSVNPLFHCSIIPAAQAGSNQDGDRQR
jgi:hypothetical protein